MERSYKLVFMYLYEGIELIMQSVFVAAIKISVESVAESVISVYNRHNSDIRPMEENQMNDEMFVALNGPEIGEANEVLKEALKLHFEDSRVHFTNNNPLQLCPVHSCPFPREG